MKGKNIWDKQFSREPYSYGKDPNPFIRANSSYFEKNAHIACFAEGEGRNAIYLAKQNFSVTVFDLSSVGLTHAEQHAKQEDVQIQTRQTDLTEKIHFPNEYDGAILTFGHVHKDKQRTFMNNLRQSVKKGGFILIEVYSDRQRSYRTGGPKNKDMLYKMNDLWTWFQEDEWIHFYYGETERNEGTLHTGVGHVIQLIAKKG